MEALLEREGKVDSWNNERLDELSGRTDAGFKEMREGFANVNQEMKEGFARIDRKFEQVATRGDLQFLSARFDKLLFTLLVIAATLVGTAITAVAGLT